MKKYFGTDGIRGIVDDNIINENFAFRLGQAMILFCREKGLPTNMIIGNDTRWSAGKLRNAVISGISAAGGDFKSIDIVPTPVLAFYSKAEDFSLGLMITASHNDYRFNGFKLFDKNGEKLNHEEELIIERLIDGAKEGIGLKENKKQEQDSNNINDYIKKLADVFTGHDLSGFNIAMDCANGATFQLAPRIYEQFGNKVSPLFINPNKTNINCNCGSQFPEKLAREVIRNKSDIGITFDGDGDRVIVVDEKGKILTGDHILYILGSMMKERDELCNNILVSTVMSNMGFVKALEGLGIKHEQSDVGDYNVHRVMKKVSANLGGEEAGHIILSDFGSSGDGILTGLKVLKAMRFFNKPLSELARGFVMYPKVLKNIEVPQKPDIKTFPGLVRLLKNIEDDLAGEGRILVRYSGTEPLCRVMVEGRDEKKAEKHVDSILAEIKKSIA